MKGKEERREKVQVLDEEGDRIVANSGRKGGEEIGGRNRNREKERFSLLAFKESGSTCTTTE